MSEDLSFHQKMVLLISELKAPKGQKNKFGNYNFRSAEDIMEAVKPLAVKYDLLPNLTDELIKIGDRYYIKATASITDGVDTISAVGYARESESKKGMDDSQVTGTASSYARKYAMNGLYQIDDTKDADTNEYKQQNDSATPTQITKIQAEALTQKISSLAELATEKTGSEVTFKQMIDKITDTKFMKVIPIETLDTEQFVTVNRYAGELETAYKKKKV